MECVFTVLELSNIQEIRNEVKLKVREEKNILQIELRKKVNPQKVLKTFKKSL